jgi:heat shock protein HtpX
MAVDWPRARGLTTRMGVALALVVALPFAFAWVALFTMNTVGVGLLAFATDRPWNGSFYIDPLVLVGMVAVGFGAQYLLAERNALATVDARKISPEEYPEVHAALTRLSRGADVPTPDLAVSRSDVPNAFTVGVDPTDATVVVTEGLLRTLDDRERDAVLAHELAHVRNRDVGVMSLAYFLPSLTYAVATLAYLVLAGLFRVLGSGFHAVDDDAAKGVAVAVVVLVVSAVCTLLVSAVFWVGSFLLFRVLSQYREFAADRGAAAITGDPGALASALRRLDDGMSAVPDDDLRSVDGGIEALYVAPIDTYQFGGDRDLVSSDVFPATHPGVDERVERLRALDRAQETDGPGGGSFDPGAAGETDAAVDGAGEADAPANDPDREGAA